MRPGRHRRHTSNKGRRRILNGTHEYQLRRVAEQLGLPYDPPRLPFPRPANPSKGDPDGKK